MTGVYLDIRPGAEHIAARVETLLGELGAVRTDSADASIQITCMTRAAHVELSATTARRVLVAVCTTSECRALLGTCFDDILPPVSPYLDDRLRELLQPGLAKAKGGGLLTDYEGIIFDTTRAGNGAWVAHTTILAKCGLRVIKTRRLTTAKGRLLKKLPPEESARFEATKHSFRYRAR